MQELLYNIEKINSKINNLVWGTPMLVLIISIGVYLTIRLKFFQLFKIKQIYNSTVKTLFIGKNKAKKDNRKGITQFQAISTALAATIGTGSIAGVATAITIGGAGAVFWMWVSAIFGMATIYAENILGIYFRKKDAKKEWQGGAMYYIQYGLDSKWLAILFAIFCVFASFGMGNMVQANSVSTSLQETYILSPKITGIIISVIVGLIIIGGIKRIGKVSEILVPIISVIYVIGTLIVIFANIKGIPSIFSAIFKQAFGIGAFAGGITGAAVKNAISMGVKRGVFSNEAGLGSSVVVHTAADVKEPVVQGMWGIVEVFIDTIVVCTLTALVILSSGVLENSATKGLDGSPLVIASFREVMGDFASHLVTFFIVIFAFATIIGWAYIGEKAMEYIFGSKSIIVYKILFVAFVYVGCNMEMKLAWDISDTFNGLMAIPNLIALAFLSPLVIKITKNYMQRKSKKHRLKPMLSAFKDIQDEQQEEL
jgi:AGCS family alanine or glycine:cation symporter